MSDLNPDLFTESEAAEFIGVEPQTLATWRCKKRYALPFLKIGRLVRYRKVDLEAWLETRLVGAGQE